jgi:hypothetical protein
MKDGFRDANPRRGELVLRAALAPGAKAAPKPFLIGTSEVKVCSGCSGGPGLWTTWTTVAKCSDGPGLWAVWTM